MGWIERRGHMHTIDHYHGWPPPPLVFGPWWTIAWIKIWSRHRLSDYVKAKKTVSSSRKTQREEIGFCFESEGTTRNHENVCRLRWDEYLIYGPRNVINYSMIHRSRDLSTRGKRGLRTHMLWKMMRKGKKQLHNRFFEWNKKEYKKIFVWIKSFIYSFERKFNFKFK